jgi:hypothetical protein
MAAAPDPQKQISMIAKAVGMDPNLLGKIGTLLGLSADATPDDVKKAIEDFSAKMDQITALLDKGGPAADAAPPDANNPNPPDSAPAMAAARLVTLTGRQSLSEALDTVDAWRASHIAHEADVERIAKERAALETGERRDLVAKLVKLGREIPATAWADEAGTVPVPLYRDMPIAALRDRVAKLGGAPGAAPGGSRLEPPTGGNAHGLTDQQIAICREQKIDTADYARTLKTHAPRS